MFCIFTLWVPWIVPKSDLFSGIKNIYLLYIGSRGDSIKIYDIMKLQCFQSVYSPCRLRDVASLWVNRGSLRASILGWSRGNSVSFRRGLDWKFVLLSVDRHAFICRSLTWSFVRSFIKHVRCLSVKKQMVHTLTQTFNVFICIVKLKPTN